MCIRDRTGLLAVPILGEQLSAVQIVGSAAVLIGIYIVHRSRTDLSRPAPSAVAAGEEPPGQLIEAGQLAPELVGQDAGDDGRAEAVE